MQKLLAKYVVSLAICLNFLGCDAGSITGGDDKQWVPVIPGGPRDWYGVWNPTRDIIAYEHEPVDPYSKPPGIYMIDPDGSNDTLVIRYGRFPSWSPSGDTIAYIDFFDRNLYVYSLLTGQSTQLTTTGDNRFTAFSWDGKSIAVSNIGNASRRWSVKIVNLPDGSSGYVGRRAPADIGDRIWPKWVPGQNVIAFQVNLDIYQIDLETDGVSLLMNSSQMPSWTPSGDSLCYIRMLHKGYEARIRDLVSGEEDVIGRQIYPNFSRDGRKIVYSYPTKVDWRGLETDRYFLRVYNLQTGEDYQLTH